MSSKQQHNFTGTVYLAADHAGYELKEFVEDKLAEHGYKIFDLGAHEHDPHDDYPAIIHPAAKKVSHDPHARGIIFGKSGQGEAICANRVKGVRATIYYGGPQEIIRLAREHNDANVLSLAGGFLTPEEAWEAVHLFLGTPFSGAERHVRRNLQLDGSH